MATPAELEAARIRAEYERRERELGDKYALSRPPNLFFRHGQQRALLRALHSAKLLPLRDRKILDVGCGRASWLAMLEEFGATPARFAGIDLSEQRIADARVRYPTADLRVGDATELPWSDGAFDIVLQGTMFTSILAEDVRRAAAREMCRVLARDGVMLWYDFRYNNPANPNVRGIGARELRSLFPDMQIELTSVTLAPPLARRLVGRGWLLAEVLERLTVLNTHYLAVIRR